MLFAEIKTSIFKFQKFVKEVQVHFKSANKLQGTETRWMSECLVLRLWSGYECFALIFEGLYA